MNIIFNFFGSVLEWLCKLFGNNYTLALIVFTLIMQIVLLPFGIKQQKNSIKQAKLAPKTAALRKKYAGRTDKATQQKLQQEQMELYKRENFNPASGCLPLLIQMPILILLYQVVIKPLSYISKITNVDQLKEIILKAYPDVSLRTELDVVHYISKMGKPAFDGVITWSEHILPDFNLFNIDLTQYPSDFKTAGWVLLLVPIVTFISMYGSQMITRKFTYQSQEQKDAQNNISMKIMTVSMPLFSVYLAYSYPATLGVYWIIRNVFMTIQQIVLAKTMPPPQYTEEDFRAAERELNGKTPKREKRELDPARPKGKSLHHIDDDEDIPSLPPKPYKNDIDDDEVQTDTVYPETKSDTFVEAAPIKTDDRNMKYKVKSRKSDKKDNKND